MIVALLRRLAIVRRLCPSEALRGQTLWLFAGVLTIAALAKGTAFIPAYSIDDYALVLQGSPARGMLGEGRFGQSLVAKLFAVVGLEPQYAQVFFVAFGIVTWSLLGILVARQWGLERKGWLTVAVGGLVASHPYTAEIFTFRTALGTAAVALALLALLLVPRRWSPLLVLIGAAIFAFALSLDRVVLNVSLMIALLGAALSVTRRLALEGTRSSRAQVWLPAVRNLMTHRRLGFLTCTAMGTGGCILAAWALSRVSNIALVGRPALLPHAAIAHRVSEIGQALRFRLLAGDDLVARFTKWLLLLLLVSALAALLTRARPWLRGRNLLPLLAVFALIAAALLWKLGVILVFEDFWPAPRALSHSGVFWAGILAIAFRCSGRVARRGLALLFFVVVLSFIGSNNRILRDQLRLNQRDALRATRIVARLEALPDFSGTERVAMIGEDSANSLAFATVDHDMNISAFGASWARVALLQEISGYSFGEAEDEASRQAAAAYCKGSRPWPSPESVTIQDQLAVVCLPD